MINFPETIWRVIKSPPARGAWNMAVDESILESTIRSAVPPTVRLYAWEPPCFSLGYAQPFSDVSLSHLRILNWDIVRRPTGGRAILHTDELTYSVIGSQNDPRLSGDVLETYRNISLALLNALVILGVPAVQQPSRAPAGISRPLMNPGHKLNPVCFEVPSDYEITCQNRKLIGSAQARRKRCLLQHGSLPLHGDLTRILKVLKFADQTELESAQQNLVQRATTIEQVLGYKISWEDAANAFLQAFSETLNLVLEESELTADEIKRAEELVETKYRHSSWTQRVN